MRTDFPHLNAEERMEFVDGSLIQYLNGGRIAYQKIFDAVKQDCDVLLDGQLPLEVMVSDVMNKLDMLHFQ